MFILYENDRSVSIRLFLSGMLLFSDVKVSHGSKSLDELFDSLTSCLFRGFSTRCFKNSRKHESHLVGVEDRSFTGEFRERLGSSQGVILRLGIVKESSCDSLISLNLLV